MSMIMEISYKTEPNKEVISTELRQGCNFLKKYCIYAAL
jgi:hypothetical protein